MKKINLGLLFGGKSAEHAVSLQSVQNIIEAIDKEKYDLTLIGIDKTGQWNLYSKDMVLQAGNSLQHIKAKIDSKIVFTLGDGVNEAILSCKDGTQQAIDVIFPVPSNFSMVFNLIQMLFRSGEQVPFYAIHSFHCFQYKSGFLGSRLL